MLYRLSEQLQALGGKALVLGLVQVCRWISLQLLLDSYEVLLGMWPDLCPRPSLHELLHLLPVLPEVLDSYRHQWVSSLWEDITDLPYTNFLCSSLVHLPAVFPMSCAYVTFLSFFSESSELRFPDGLLEAWESSLSSLGSLKSSGISFWPLSNQHDILYLIDTFEIIFCRYFINWYTSFLLIKPKRFDESSLLEVITIIKRIGCTCVLINELENGLDNELTIKIYMGYIHVLYDSNVYAYNSYLI